MSGGLRITFINFTNLMNFFGKIFPLLSILKFKNCSKRTNFSLLRVFLLDIVFLEDSLFERMKRQSVELSAKRKRESNKRKTQKYYKKNKESIAECQREYQVKNKQSIAAYKCKEYYKSSKELISHSNHKYYELKKKANKENKR